MTNLFTLDSLREEADKVYAPLVVTLSNGTKSELRNILRLGKKTREAILASVDSINQAETTVDQIEKHAELIIKGVATNSTQLLRDLDGDIAVSMKLIEKWVEGTQLPEAEPSPSS